MPPPIPRGQQSGDKLSYVEKTSTQTITATTEAGAEVWISGTEIYVDGATEICVEIYAYYMEVTGQQAVLVNLWEDSTDKGRALAHTANSGTGNQGNTALSRRFLTPSAGRHTYHAKAWKTGGTASIYSGTGVSGGGLPGYLRVVKA